MRASIGRDAARSWQLQPHIGPEGQRNAGTTESWDDAESSMLSESQRELARRPERCPESRLLLACGSKNGGGAASKLRTSKDAGTPAPGHKLGLLRTPVAAR